MARVRKRQAPLEMTPAEFRGAGHELVERIAGFLQSLPERPVTPGLAPRKVRSRLGGGRAPKKGVPARRLLREASDLLFSSSLFTGHPRFLGYIVASPAPVGALGEMLAAAVNANLGAWTLSPMATEIEAQAVRWIAEMLGYPTTAGGLLTSGGNVANFIGFLAARRAGAPWNVRESGVGSGPGPLCLYASEETHTWVQKAADLFGLGTGAIRFVPTGGDLRIDMQALRSRIRDDRKQGAVPFLVVGTAGTVSTGAVDPLPEMAALCRREKLWFHVDAAYGGFAAKVRGAPPDLAGIALADSVAVDPHKWLYAPLEAGCALVRDRGRLLDAFHYRPPYYQFGDGEADETTNFYELGIQNSRGFRALKVWLGLRQAGQSGYRRMIAEDMRLARLLWRGADRHPELEAGTCELSITTFRYVPQDLGGRGGREEDYLNRLNTELLSRLQQGGEAYLSNAVVAGRFLLRSCVVNFRTDRADIEALPEIVVRVGRRVDRELRPKRPPRRAARGPTKVVRRGEA
jgi:aromatic-L-amino-acid decarboxylase